MKLTFDVSFEDGRQIKVTAGPRDQLVWEQAGADRAFGMLLGRGYKVGELYSLAHAALKRQKLWTGTLTELQELADVELGSEEPSAGEDVDDEVPTPAAPTSDS
ncbi:hypothetical protein ACIRG5_42325 [Lentzea sp. NPDC102401]|uniref:hypothetical protein n=1 Tax=Lentzea sp. NPDC102401 TaxID=3364128 RepID=UPI003822687D